MNKKEQITTSRLTLKSYADEDLEILAHLLLDPLIAKTYMIPDFHSLEEAIPLARKIIQYSKVEEKEHIVYGIYLQERLIGMINDCGFDEEEIELGYMIDSKEWNHGYASEALQAMISGLFDQGISKIITGYFVENKASERVMIKCGMKKMNREDEIEYRGQIKKCHYYCIQKGG